MQVQWAGGDGRAAGRGAPQHRAAQRGGRPGLPLPPPTIQQDCSPSPPPANGLGAPPPHMTLVPRRSRPHSNRRPRGNAPPHPPSSSPHAALTVLRDGGRRQQRGRQQQQGESGGERAGARHPPGCRGERGGREGREEGGRRSGSGSVLLRRPPTAAQRRLPRRHGRLSRELGGAAPVWAEREGSRGVRSAGFAFPPQAPSCARFEMGLVVLAGRRMLRSCVRAEFQSLSACPSR